MDVGSPIGSKVVSRCAPKYILRAHLNRRREVIFGELEPASTFGSRTSLMKVVTRVTIRERAVYAFAVIVSNLAAS